MTMQKRMTGFTLGELAVTVAVATILFAFAIPSMQMMLENNRLTTQTNAFLAAINLARSEAIRRNTRVTLCKSADQATCTGGGGYEQGWIIFVDRNDNATVDVGEEILRVNQALRGDITILGNTANVANYISFNSSGSSRLIGGVAGAFQAGTIEVRVPKVTSWYNAVVLAHGGRVRVQKKP